jgi:2-phospho-L-lactate guanylyltransferase
MPLQKSKIPNADLWAVMPVKPLHLSKQRLTGNLGAHRSDLTLAMLRDVLHALGASRTVRGVLVVTLDAVVAEVARAEGATVVEEAGAFGMNRAVAQGMQAARRAGAAWVVVVPVDIPLLTGAEFDRLVSEFQSQAGGDAGPSMGIVSSGDHGGTNWLCLATERPFKPSYGPDSYRRHLEQARAEGLRPHSLNSPLVSMDIDEPGDLDEFESFCLSHPSFQATRTWRFLRLLRPAETADRSSGAHAMEESNYACGKS